LKKWGSELAETLQPLRVAIIGTSGSGKSTFAGALSEATGIARIELDLINWRPGWFNRSREDKEAFVADVAMAASVENWVLAGNYTVSRPAYLPRVTDIVWLNLPRSLIMRQVIWRSLKRAASGDDVFPGCREDWTRMLGAEHPIRWAWDTYDKRNREAESMIADPAMAHVTFHRCQSRAEAEIALRSLAQRFNAQRQ
jgi:adenylate kinase family enzyme